jgi:streptogramin lyase
MKRKAFSGFGRSTGLRAILMGTVFAATAACTQSQDTAATEDGVLLYGHVTAEDGSPLAGVPVRARGAGKTYSVVVYSDSEGEYSFPEWSDLTPGTTTVSIKLPDYEHVAREAVALNEGASAEVDFALIAREPDLADATASEILAALPGTDHQKMLFSQCSNCHTLQRAMRWEFDQEGWEEIIHLMAGQRRTAVDFPGSYTYGQDRFVEPLAEYIASFRGPGTSENVPFKLRPRPTSEEASRLVMTEYDLPRGGQFELYMVRGDSRFVWPHDVVVDDQYAYYTDHFSNALGRLDKATGEVTELIYPVPPGGGREMAPPGQLRAGNPGGGAHDLWRDSQGNLIIGMGGATVRYNVADNSFDEWQSGESTFGLGPDDHVWHIDDGGPLVELNTHTGEIIEHPVPDNSGVYDMETDSQGRTVLDLWRDSGIGLYDPRTNEYHAYEIPTEMSGPRRGEVDAEDNFWTTLFYSGSIARFDPDTGDIKEYPLHPGTEPFSAPYSAPYSLSIDNENGWVWTTDFNANRLFRIDIETGESIEYFMPDNYVMRDLTVEEGTERPTLWIPSYRPPSQIVKVQIR